MLTDATMNSIFYPPTSFLFFYFWLIYTVSLKLWICHEKFIIEYYYSRTQYAQCLFSFNHHLQHMKQTTAIVNLIRTYGSTLLNLLKCFFYLLSSFNPLFPVPWWILAGCLSPAVMLTSPPYRWTPSTCFYENLLFVKLPETIQTN